MKNLVRGGVLGSLLSLFVVIVYAQARPETTLASGSDSQAIIQHNNNLNNLTNPSLNTNTNSNPDTTKGTKNDKKLVKTTASVRPAGASRGSFSATAYCLPGRTSMGHSVRRGIIAADPRVLKLGSTVYVNAGPWSGNYLVSDTGGAVKGKKVDIWVPSCSEARRFGRRSVEVFSLQ